MKKAEGAAERLGQKNTAQDAINLAWVGERRAIYQLRQRQIEHASVVWMMDENCWQ